MEDYEVPLPKIIFLSGADQAIRTRFAAELVDYRHDVMALAFAEPLRGAVLGTFFQCDPLLDLQAPNLKLPGVPDDSKTFQFKYAEFLFAEYGSGVIGKLMLQRLEDQKDFYDTFIFDDCEYDRLHDMLEIIKVAGPDNCLHIEIGLLNTNSILGTSVRFISLAFPDIKTFLSRFSILSTTP